MATIDERAQIHPSVELGKDVQIGPWSFIEEGVKIGEGTIISPHVVIRAGTQIGKNNRIHSFVSLGDDPQTVGTHKADTCLEIGDENIIREYVSIHRGTEKGGGITRLGNKNYLMAYSHVGHDCELKNEVMLVNHATLAGHVIINDFAMIGAFCGIHQFVTIGAYCFVAQSCLIGKNTIPYTLIAGHTATARVYGLNLVGLRRRGFSREAIRKIQSAYKVIYDLSIPLSEIPHHLSPLISECPEIQLMLDAILEAEKGRGFIRKSRQKEQKARDHDDEEDLIL